MCPPPVAILCLRFSSSSNPAPTASVAAPLSTECKHQDHVFVFQGQNSTGLQIFIKSMKEVALLETQELSGGHNSPLLRDQEPVQCRLVSTGHSARGQAASQGEKTAVAGAILVGWLLHQPPGASHWGLASSSHPNDNHKPQLLTQKLQNTRLCSRNFTLLTHLTLNNSMR